MRVYKFEFTDYCVDVDVAGHQFKLDCSSDTGDYMKMVSGEMKELAAAIKKGEKTNDDAIVFGKQVINTLLGNGVSDKILNGRKCRVSDLTDLLLFLNEVAAEYQRERQKRAMNRAQRRVASKK